MTIQRRRGRTAQIYSVEEITDRRGNRTQVPGGTPTTVTAWAIPDRGARAELPGQQQVRIVKLGTRHDISGVNIWSRVRWDGEWWDIVEPPAEHWGTRHVRHWSLQLRWRPDSNGGM